MAAVTVADVILIVFAYKIGQGATARFCSDLRAEIFAKVNSMPADTFKKMGTGALITRSIEDVDRGGGTSSTLF